MDKKTITRRHFFGQVGRNAGFGIGAFGLGNLLARDGLAASGAPNVRGLAGLHFPARAKNIIFLFMAGAPSQLDLFDHKPLLNRMNGEACPESLIKGERFAFIKGRPRLLGSPFAFKKYGKSGLEVSELMPHTARIVDDLAFVKSMHTTQFNHAPAQLFMNTGHQIMGRPSLGAWLSYGLGSENQDLPGFVVLLSGQNAPDGGKSCWGAGYLPTLYQGVQLRSKGDPVLYLSNPDGVNAPARRNTLDAVNDLNRMHRDELHDPEIDTRIASYEMAYRMQTSVPDLMDISKEPKAVHEAYGTEPGKSSFANNCLLARRLVERGVRSIQLFHRGWDHHGSALDVDLLHALPERCREVDRAGAALVSDLKQRGLLDETLVVWGGEFGRTSMNEERSGSKLLGRDHHPRAFTMWCAGGGIRPGTVVGSTDDFGYNIAHDPVHVHDLHATLLHQMGVDHERLTFRFQGRDYRLTDVHGTLVKQLLV